MKYAVQSVWHISTSIFYINSPLKNDRSNGGPYEQVHMQLSRCISFMKITLCFYVADNNFFIFCQVIFSEPLSGQWTAFDINQSCWLKANWDGDNVVSNVLVNKYRCNQITSHSSCKCSQIGWDAYFSHSKRLAWSHHIEETNIAIHGIQCE